MKETLIKGGFLQIYLIRKVFISSLEKHRVSRKLRDIFVGTADCNWVPPASKAFFLRNSEQRRGEIMDSPLLRAPLLGHQNLRE